MSLTKRTQILLDDELHARLRDLAARREISIGALIREAIDEKLSRVQETRANAINELLTAPPMPVDDWPVMKREMIEDMNADTYD